MTQLICHHNLKRSFNPKEVAQIWRAGENKTSEEKKSSLNVHSSLLLGEGVLATDLKHGDIALKVICTVEKSSSSSLRWGSFLKEN